MGAVTQAESLRWKNQCAMAKSNRALKNKPDIYQQVTESVPFILLPIIQHIHILLPKASNLLATRRQFLLIVIFKCYNKLGKIDQFFSSLKEIFQGFLYHIISS